MAEASSDTRTTRSAPLRPAPATGERPLHLCPACDSRLVYPVWWEENGRDRWSIDLRCPECEWTDSGVFEQEVADAFDEALDRGTDALARDLERLVRSNMAELAGRFANALALDAILPEDF